MCAICGKRNRGVKSYRVDFDDGFLAVDLCREHSAPLGELKSSVPEHHFIRVEGEHNRTRATKFRITTLEEIEAKKKRK